jgi:hypothetical protein
LPRARLPKHHGPEAQLIACELGTYNYETSPFWHVLRNQFSSGVRQRELSSVATVLCSLIETFPLPTRSEKRSFPLLIRWFEQNWTEIAPFLPLINLCTESFEVINFARERLEIQPHHFR